MHKKTWPTTVTYRNPAHRTLPHVVKLSGGRTSAAMLERLLDTRSLDAERGDVVVFNNTAAEHSATYEFVTRVLRQAQNEQIPSFITEFVTYEDVMRGEWARLPGYRITTLEPRERCEQGYEHEGEVYEEMVSWSGFLPNRFTRTCTKHLKIDVTSRFMRDWTRAQQATPRLGHFSEKTRLTLDAAVVRHRKAGGKLTRDELARSRAYAWNRPFSHEGREYSIGCSVQPRHQQHWMARNAPGFVSLIGLRADENKRIAQTMKRATEDAVEQPYAPMQEWGVTKTDVLNHWEGRRDDLRIEPSLDGSNCVFCFMKSAQTLRALARGARTTGRPTPSDPRWWIDLEAKYGGTRTRFMGSGKGLETYPELLGGRRSLEAMDAPCECAN